MASLGSEVGDGGRQIPRKAHLWSGWRRLFRRSRSICPISIILAHSTKRERLSHTDATPSSVMYKCYIVILILKPSRYNYISVCVGFLYYQKYIHPVILTQRSLSLKRALTVFFRDDIYSQLSISLGIPDPRFGPLQKC